MKAFDIITSAMRSLNVLGTGEVPSAEEAQDALNILNLMLDTWNSQRMMIIALTSKEFPLTAGKQTYTLGAGGDINITPRPARVERYGIVNLNNPAQPLELPLEMLTVDQWAAIPVKQVSSTLPTKIYDDQAFPLRNLSFWPYPTVQVNLRPYYWGPLGSVASIHVPLSFPPGYMEAVKYNLAVRLAPEFGTTAPPDVVALANQAKSWVKTMNSPVKDLRVDSALARGDQVVYNWRTDGPISH